MNAVLRPARAVRDDLRDKEIMLTSAQRLAGIGGWVWDLRTDRATWSDETYRLLGLGPEDCDSSMGGLLAWVHPEDRKNLLAQSRRVASGEPHFSYRFRVTGADGCARLLQGDGEVALILDTMALAQHAGVVSEGSSHTETGETEHASSGERAHLLVAGLSDGRQVALPLDAVDRLEEIAQDRVERIGSQEVVQYRGRVLPLVRLDHVYGAYGVEEATGGPLQVVLIGTSSPPPKSSQGEPAYLDTACLLMVFRPALRSSRSHLLTLASAYGAFALNAWQSGSMRCLPSIPNMHGHSCRITVNSRSISHVISKSPRRGCAPGVNRKMVSAQV